MTSRWPSRTAAFLLWGLAAAAAVFWMLRVAGMSDTAIEANPVAEPVPSISVAELAKALGPATVLAATAQVALVAPSAPDPGASMRLLGVIAGRKSGGVALISINGQVAQPYRVGSQVDDTYRLAKVDKRSATLASNQTADNAITLELPSTSTPVAASQQLIGASGRLGARFGELPPTEVIAAPIAGVPEESPKD